MSFLQMSNLIWVQLSMPKVYQGVNISYCNFTERVTSSNKLLVLDRSHWLKCVICQKSWEPKLFLVAGTVSQRRHPFWLLRLHFGRSLLTENLRSQISVLHPPGPLQLLHHLFKNVAKQFYSFGLIEVQIWFNFRS